MDEGLQTYAKKKRSHRVLRTILTVFLILAVSATAGYFLLRYYFVVKEVSIQSSALYTPEDMKAALSIEENTPFYTLSKKELSEALTSNFPYLVNPEISYDLPHTLSVKFEEKYGEIAYYTGADLFALSTDLTVIARENRDSTIPRTTLYCDGIARCIVGEKVRFFEEDVGELIENLIAALRQTGFMEQTKEIDVRDKFNVRVNINDQYLVLLGENEDFSSKLALTRAVINDLSEGETATIDAADSNNAYVSLGIPQW